MRKIIRDNFPYVFVPAMIIVVSLAVIFTKTTKSASEWETLRGPIGYENAEIHDVASHYHDGNYYVWAVGKWNNPATGKDNALVYTFDPFTLNWLVYTSDQCEALYAVDFLYDENDVTPYELWAVGGNNSDTACVYYSPDGAFEHWSRIWNTSGPKYKALRAVSFINNPAGGTIGWVAGLGQDLLETTDKGLNWTTKASSPGGLNIYGIDSVNVGGAINAWAAGAGKICRRDNATGNWPCTTSSPIGSYTFRDIAISNDGKAWAAIESRKFGYWNGSAWSVYETGLDKTAASGDTMYGVTAVTHTDGSKHVWFSGENGTIIFGKDGTNGQGWFFQATEVTKTLYGVSAVNRTHAWAVGASNALLKISPGNVAGWGWVGANNCNLADCTGTLAQNPVGWLSFNCANNDVCDTTTFSYGVNVKKKKEAYACNDDIQDKDVGALSGYAWFIITNDSTNYSEYDPAANCVSGVCSNNPNKNCTTKDQCAYCSSNNKSCRPIAWLSFERDDAVNVADYEPLPGEPYRIFPFTTPCSKTISQTDPENYVMATFDYNTYAVKGWARFKLGQCSVDPNKACFKDGDCGGGTCDYKNRDYKNLGEAKGWVKLRGGTHLEPAPDYSGTASYNNCQACKIVNPDGTENNGDEYLTCKICEGTVNAKKYTCNKCGEKGETQADLTYRCGDGRCSDDNNKVCFSGSNPDRCEIEGVGTCTPLNNYVCNACALCDAYGISVDVEGGKWYGQAWSEDFGWIDVSRAGLYASAWFQAQFGDVYARGVGTSEMTLAPGFEDIALQEKCNATYLVLANQYITNFCTKAYWEGEGKFYRTRPSQKYPVTTGANPYLVEQYRAFDLPEGQNILGKIDYSELITYSRLRTDNKNNIRNSIFSAILSNIDLDGKVYRFTNAGGLTINEPITFIRGNDTDGKGLSDNDGYTSGAGLFVIDGNLTIEKNIFYNDNNVQNLKELPSVGFYVKGDIIIKPGVTHMVGTYFAAGKIITEKGEDQLKVDGLMIAKEFDFNRTFMGTIQFPEPAEMIKYDGRVQANPPPGFQDFTKVLPDFREVTP